MNEGFTYVADPHGYWLGQEELPSPSSVFQDLGLVDRRWFTPERRVEGQIVHAAIPLAVDGRLDWTSVAKPLHGYITSALRLIDRLKPRILRWETSLYHPKLRFAGTFDIEWDADGFRWVVDWKTGKAPKVAQIQTAAYESLVRAQDPGFVGMLRRCAVELFPDGSIGNRVPHDSPTDGQAWLNLVGAYRVRQNVRARELATIE